MKQENPEPEGKKVTIKSYATVNSGEIRFGRSVEEELFGKKYCKDCDKQLPETAEKRPDPYHEELHDDHTPVYICDECYQISLEEI